MSVRKILLSGFLIATIFCNLDAMPSKAIAEIKSYLSSAAEYNGYFLKKKDKKFMILAARLGSTSKIHEIQSLALEVYAALVNHKFTYCVGDEDILKEASLVAMDCLQSDHDDVICAALAVYLTLLESQLFWHYCYRLDPIHTIKKLFSRKNELVKKYALRVFIKRTQYSYSDNEISHSDIGMALKMAQQIAKKDKDDCSLLEFFDILVKKQYLDSRNGPLSGKQVLESAQKSIFSENPLCVTATLRLYATLLSEGFFPTDQLLGVLEIARYHMEKKKQQYDVPLKQKYDAAETLAQLCIDTLLKSSFPF